MNSKQIIEDLVNDIAQTTLNSPTLAFEVDLAIDEAIKKSVLVYARRFVRSRLAEDDVNTEEIRNILNILFDESNNLEKEVIAKIAKLAIEKLKPQMTIQ